MSNHKSDRPTVTIAGECRICLCRVRCPQTRAKVVDGVMTIPCPTPTCGRRVVMTAVKAKS